MKKDDIVNEVAKVVGTKNKAQVIVNSIFSQIKDTLK
jgi:nucleoid DNA-binding protein